MLEGSLSESSSALHPDFGRDVCTHHKVLFFYSQRAVLTGLLKMAKSGFVGWA